MNKLIDKRPESTQDNSPKVDTGNQTTFKPLTGTGNRGPMIDLKSLNLQDYEVEVNQQLPSNENSPKSATLRRLTGDKSPSPAYNLAAEMSPSSVSQRRKTGDRSSKSKRSASRPQSVVSPRSILKSDGESTPRSNIMKSVKWEPKKDELKSPTAGSIKSASWKEESEKTPLNASLKET